MASLFSRFLGKKKNADQNLLLDGEKFEAVPKTTSPSAATFDQSAQRMKSKEKERDKSKRTKRSAAGLHNSKTAESVPTLSLSLPDIKDDEKKSEGLGVVFEGITDGPKTLDDEALGQKRLTPSQALSLVQKTSEVLTERGLETLGVMRPHWFASPRQQEIQLKLIHRFLATLESQQPNADPSSPTPQSAFESELRYSRDPHDVAAVLRWGLRHLQLEGNSFGQPGAGDWYRKFADTERSSSYPKKAFDDILVPLLPPPHTDLVRATLDMVSSLAAHSEENGISGNKLSKVLGWWVLSSRNLQGVKWPDFYAQWEAAARQFEHLFLAYIRVQDAQSRMPKRLTELVKNYPFSKYRRDDDGVFLPKTRLSTRSADALFVQVTIDKSTACSRPHPLRIMEDALGAVAEDETTTASATFWEEIRKAVSQPAQPENKSGEEVVEAKSQLNLSAVLADESIRLFSLVPMPDGAGAPTLSLFTPLPTHSRSLSAEERLPLLPTTNGYPQSFKESTSHGKATISPSSSSQGHDVIADWQAFSSSGFHSPSGLSLAASLFDNDTEVSQPASKKAVGITKRSSKTGSSRRRSAEQPISTRPAPDFPKSTRRTHSTPRMIKVDEAFIDFWADSLLDSIARTWPTFVVCQLKPLPGLKRAEDGKPIEWLIIERVISEPSRPPPVKTSMSARAASPLPSPTASDGSKKNLWSSSTLAAARKRFSLFSPKHETAPVAQGGRDRTAKKAAKEAKVGEFGEILKEEDETAQNGVKTNGTEKTGGAEKPETPQSSKEIAENLPTIQVNGVSKSEEAHATMPAKPSAPEENLVVPADPDSKEHHAESPLPSNGDTDIPKQAEVAGVSENVQPSQSGPVADELVETRPTTGFPPTTEAQPTAKAQPIPEAQPTAEAPAKQSHSLAPTDAAAPTANDTIEPTPAMPAAPLVPEKQAAKSEAVPVHEPSVEDAAAESRVAASTAGVSPSAAAAETAATVEPVADSLALPAEETPVREPVHEISPESQVGAAPSNGVPAGHEPVKESAVTSPVPVLPAPAAPAPAPAPAPIASTPDPAPASTPTPDPAPAAPALVEPEKNETAQSGHTVEATTEGTTPLTTVEVSSSDAAAASSLVDEQSTFIDQSATHDDDVQSSSAAPEVTLEPTHSEHPAPVAEAPADEVEREPSVVTEDVAKVDDVDQDVPTEEKFPEESPEAASS